jgi:hypothetical protein
MSLVLAFQLGLLPWGQARSFACHHACHDAWTRLNATDTATARALGYPENLFAHQQPIASLRHLVNSQPAAGGNSLFIAGRISLFLTVSCSRMTLTS